MTKDVDMGLINLLVHTYLGYSLVIGITSHRLINERFRSTIFSKYYALIVNALVVALLPFVMWDTRNCFQDKMHFPQLILITNNVRYTVTYIVILYTVLSRGFRDTAFREMGPLLRTLFKEEKRCGGCGISRTLAVLMYAKYITLTWLVFTETSFLFYANKELSFMVLARFLFLTIANSMLLMVPMGYFLAQWHIARGFNGVNQRLNDIVASPSPRDLKELHHLWSLHRALTKSALNINKIYGPQMLASRFDNFTFSVIQAYWGAFFTFGMTTPIYWIVHGFLEYIMRSVDNYLTDYMCDVLVEYQSTARHAWSEQRCSKEVL